MKNFISRLEDLTTGKQREVIHFHYTTWPDFGVPQSPTAFLRFLNVVRNSGALDENVGPPVVHCSAGIGRSGTFCLVDSCLVLINDMKLDNIVVKDILMEMRKYRMGLIQTHDQLRFSYLAVIEGIKKAATLNGTAVRIAKHFEIFIDGGDDYYFVLFFFLLGRMIGRL